MNIEQKRIDFRGILRPLPLTDPDLTKTPGSAALVYTRDILDMNIDLISGRTGYQMSSKNDNPDTGHPDQGTYIRW